MENVISNITQNELHVTELVAVKNTRALLQYDLWEFPKAMKRLYLNRVAAARLDIAQEYLDNLSKDKERYELLVWDGFRTQETQQAIYDNYAIDIAREESISFEAAYPKAIKFVNPPDRIFPHGTGGAVDLTITINGIEAEMGTCFDEFSDRSYKDYFRDNAPKTESDTVASKNREILRSAMEHAGFIGLDNEWWHYEFGTDFWAQNTGQKVFLDKIGSCPKNNTSSPAYLSDNPCRLPVWYSGVAQVFENSTDRSDALLRNTNDHYYARSSHPTLAGLGDYIKQRIVHAKHISLVTSGMTACRTALLASMRKNGVLICDKRTYYEVGNEVKKLAAEHGWDVYYAQFDNVKEVESLCSRLVAEGKKPDAFYFDSPSNWWLKTVDLKAIKRITSKYNINTTADITIQPLQKDVLQYIDVVVLSLSKYPSLGMTLGGAIITSKSSSHDRVEAVIGRIGNRLSSDAAMTIWTQIVSLEDRIDSLEEKIKVIKRAVGSLSAVTRVNTVNPSLCSNHFGGVLVLEMKTEALAALVERLVSHSAMRTVTGLHLAYTFGGVVTTLEHFNSNPRPVSTLNPRNENLDTIPKNYVRIGVGCDTAGQIVSDLTIILNAAWNIHERGDLITRKWAQ